MSSSPFLLSNCSNNSFQDLSTLQELMNQSNFILSSMLHIVFEVRCSFPSRELSAFFTISIFMKLMDAFFQRALQQLGHKLQFASSCKLAYQTTPVMSLQLVQKIRNVREKCLLIETRVRASVSTTTGGSIQFQGGTALMMLWGFEIKSYVFWTKEVLKAQFPSNDTQQLINPSCSKKLKIRISVPTFPRNTRLQAMKVKYRFGLAAYASIIKFLYFLYSSPSCSFSTNSGNFVFQYSLIDSLENHLAAHFGRGFILFISHSGSGSSGWVTGSGRQGSCGSEAGGEEAGGSSCNSWIIPISLKSRFGILELFAFGSSCVFLKFAGGVAIEWKRQPEGVFVRVIMKDVLGLIMTKLSKKGEKGRNGVTTEQ